MEIKDREKLVAAFEHMVENVADSVRDAEAALEPTIEEMVHNAKVLARDLYALTQEEAETLAATLKRDLHKANQILNREQRELKDWFSFDLELLEDRFIDLVANAADKAWLDFRAFEQANRHLELYTSGEICNAGAFRCDACGEIVRLERTAPLPQCPACGGDQFHRQTS